MTFRIPTLLMLAALVTATATAAAQSRRGSEAAVKADAGNELLQNGDEEDEAEAEAEDEAELPVDTTLFLPPKQSQRQVDDAVRERIAHGRLPFCTNAHARISTDDRRLCTLGEAARSRCPELARACDRKSDSSTSAVPSAAPTNDRRKANQLFALGAGARIVSWVLLAAGIFAIIAVIRKNMLAGAAPQDADSVPPEARPDDETPAPRAPVETDAQRLLLRARLLAERGQYARALEETYAALLRHLDHGRLIELYPWRTNGDYVRALRDHPELQAIVRSSARDVERVQFGAAEATAEHFRTLLERVAPIVSRAVMAIACALTLLGTTGCDGLGEGADPYGVGADSSGPGGFSLLRELLESRGTNVQNRMRPLDQLEDVKALVVTDSELDAPGRAAITAFAEKGGLVVLATAVPGLGDRIGVTPVSTDCRGELEIAAELADRFGTLRVPPGFGLALGGAPRSVVLSCGDAPYLVMSSVGAGKVIALPNDDLLTNASLVTADNAQFVTALLDDLGELEIVGRFTGAGPKTPFQAVANTKLTPALVQLFLLLAVLCVAKGAAFGTPTDPPEQRRRAFTEHVRALGIVYARAKASRFVLSTYAGWALERIRERLQPGTGTSLHALAHAVAERTGRPEGEVMRVLVEARSARDDPMRDGGSAEDLETFGELERIVAAIQTPHRGMR